ncbi:hypothetical protein [Endozoicomonas ascidiicola]|uniref:hypothetical protein n=1 Tax=Endozoicomonas ascidiicola TaxID=1698521 RepID=UPI00082D7C00|nr:hypothetical protein [Endozoicomonas ascidiicola]
MRYIDNMFIDIPDGWEARATSASQQLLSGTITANDRSSIWGQLKLPLSSLSLKRCWYCETTIPRTDNAVDHYRPKGQVKGVRLAANGIDLERYDITPRHGGYKWLAFSAENFRFTCDHCNEYRKNLEGTYGGKWNYFPLIDESQRAYQDIDLDYEVPSILDPCNPLDWRLLAYDSNGKPFSRFEPGSDEDTKVCLSIRILHLDQEGLNEGRRAQWSQLQPIVASAKRQYLQVLSRRAGAQAAFTSSLKQIKQWLNPKSQSSYIGFLLYKLETDGDKELHPWIDELIRVL